METLKILYIALAAHCVYGQNANVKITEPMLPRGINSFSVLAGSMVDLVCEVRHKPEGHKVQWLMLIGSDSSSVISNDVDPKDKRFSVIKPNSITWKLRIKNVQVSMVAAYVCRVSIDINSDVDDIVYLHVIEKPRINNLLTSKGKTVTESEPLDLYCDAEGIPRPVIKWMRLALADLPGGGKELRKKELRVEQVRAEHRGKYICQADNEAGRSSRVITILVKFQPIVKAQHTKVFQAVGYAKMLTCDIEAFPQPTSEQIVWTREGDSQFLDDNFIKRTSLGANDRVTTRLYVKKVRDSDYGKYVCGASNFYGTRKVTIELIKTDIKREEPRIDIYSSSTPLSASVFTISLVITALLYRN